MKILIVVSSVLLLCHFSSGRVHGGRGRYDSSADAYSSMGDIEWKKRAGYDNWISPAYGYSSMADTEWGWKKRSDESEYDDMSLGDEDTDVDKRSKSHNSYYTPYKYRQPYSLASTVYMPHKGYAEPQSSIDAAAASAAADPANYGGVSRDTRSRGGDRQYNYASMADMDWGWKRKRSATDLSEQSKRNLASLARGNELPYKFRARRVHPNQPADEMDPFTYLNHQYNLINEQQANDEELQARPVRSGIGSLARNGGIRPANQAGRR